MIRNKRKIIFIFPLVFLLGGCAYFAEKKTEMSFSENQTVNNFGENNISEPEQKTQKEANNSDVEDGNGLEIAEKINGEIGKKETKSETISVLKINDKLVSWGYAESEKRKIDTIIIHSSYNALGGDIYDVDKIISVYKSYGVAPHYLIARNGEVYRLVADKNIAYHAGVSEVPNGRKNVNEFSLGIEIINSKTEGPSDAQYISLKKLIDLLGEEYDIQYILGHSDIASGRKDDPWKFDWNKIK